MCDTRGRRRTALVLVALAALAATGAAGSAQPQGPTLIPGAFAPGSQPDGNTIVFDAPQGLIVVDTGRHIEHTQAVLDHAQAAGKPIAAVINTHWHLDHVGGNVLVRAKYPAVRVWASSALDAALEGFLARYRQQLEVMIAQAKDAAAQKPFRDERALIDQGTKLGPDEVVTSSGPRMIAGRTLQLHLEAPAATAGDVWIFDPATRTLVSGDLVTLPAPFLDTACPRGWQAALRHLAAVDFEELIPGHGPRLDRRDFDAYRRAFDHLLACGAGSGTKSSCIDGWLADPGPLLSAADQGFTRRLMDYYVDLLRSDPARMVALCAPP